MQIKIKDKLSNNTNTPDEILESLIGVSLEVRDHTSDSDLYVVEVNEFLTSIPQEAVEYYQDLLIGKDGLTIQKSSCQIH